MANRQPFLAIFCLSSSFYLLGTWYFKEKLLFDAILNCKPRKLIAQGFAEPENAFQGHVFLDFFSQILTLFYLVLKSACYSISYNVSIFFAF